METNSDFSFIADGKALQKRKLINHCCQYSEMIIRLIDDIPADVNTMSVAGVETFAREGLHFIKSKAKQGKTTMLGLLESAYLCPNGMWGELRRLGDVPMKVLHIDTEQKRYDTQCMKRRVLENAGMSEEETEGLYTVLNLRSVVDYEEKRHIIESALKNLHPDVLVIDGIVDIMKNFNELDESKEIITWLMSIASEYKVVLFSVLHTNKNALDHNMRGHVGTFAEQKCDTTIECERDANSGIFTVKCTASRHEPFPKWSFMWKDNRVVDANSFRLEIEHKKKEEQKLKNAQDAQKRMNDRIQQAVSIVNAHSGCMARKELTSLMEQSLDLSRQTVSPLITQAIKDGFLYEYGSIVQTLPQQVVDSTE